MPSLAYKDMKVSVSIFSGDTTVLLRTLTKKLSPEDLAALLYPIFDAEEKASNPPSPPLPSSG